MFSNSAIESIIIHKTVGEIKDYAFKDCENLNKIYCKIDSKPEKWTNQWASDRVQVIWGYKDN